ncbi:MAG: alpha/beta hydrolase [Proteobacteria bacterium]|nr:alpha/beta hydrolase [Pseudomonadota bacterium]
MARRKIVFMPGLLCDATVFARQAAALVPIADVAIADFSEAKSIDEMAEIALSIFAGPVTLIGFSMGGRAALAACRLDGQRINGLCLMDTGAAPADDDEMDRRMPLVELANMEGMSALAARWLPPMVHVDRETDASLIGPLTKMVERATPAMHERQVRALVSRPDARPVLQTITCPTLVMVGRQDRWSPLADHEVMADAIPDARLAIIENCGHFAPVERPDEVTDTLRLWLGRLRDPT